MIQEPWPSVEIWSCFEAMFLLASSSFCLVAFKTLRLLVNKLCVPLKHTHLYRSVKLACLRLAVSLDPALQRQKFSSLTTEWLALQTLLPSPRHYAMTWSKRTCVPHMFCVIRIYLCNIALGMKCSPFRMVLDSTTKVCQYYGQELAHAAYYRHMNDKGGSTCPGRYKP